MQVEASFASSLQHLNVERVDSYVLHGPTGSVGISQDDWAAWRTMEQIYESGRTRLLGISNVSLEQLQTLCRDSRVQPHFVQNRCYAVRGWDREVRDFCKAEGVVYQGFSLLTASRAVMAKIAQRHHCSSAQVVFSFALSLGMIPLTGTSDAKHMKSDLDAFNLQLVPEEIDLVERLAG